MMRSLFRRLVVVGMMLCTSMASAAVMVGKAKPNIIVIYTDDQGYGDVSYLNPAAKFQTPNIDRLAREGITFTDAHCADTVCTPSRYSLLTGRYSWRTVLKRGVFGAERTCLIEDGRMTLASLLQDHGYRTAMVGKWHLGMDFPGEWGNRDWTQPVTDMPLDKGFDYYYGIPASMNYGVLAWFEGRYAKVPPTVYGQKTINTRALQDYRIEPPYESDAAPGLLEIAPDFVDSACLTRFTDKSIGWIQNHLGEQSRKPFFLYLPYTSPHKPVVPLPEFHGQGEAGAYGEFMIETDYHIGRLLDFLDDAGLAEETLIILSSDNGPESTWAEREEKFGHTSAGGFRGGKRDIYEGGHRVPFFVRWPGGVARPGRQWNGPVSQVDLLATLADLLGAKLPDDAGEDSVSFYDVLGDPESRRVARPLIHHEANGRLGIRDGAWKLVMPHGRRTAELYNLVQDPVEENNVVAIHSGIVDELQAKLTAIVGRGRLTPGAPQKNDTDWWDDLTWMTAAEYQALQAP